MPDGRKYLFFFCNSNIPPGVHVSQNLQVLHQGLSALLAQPHLRDLRAINLSLCFQILDLSQQLLLTLVAVTYSCYSPKITSAMFGNMPSKDLFCQGDFLLVT